MGNVVSCGFCNDSRGDIEYFEEDIFTESFHHDPIKARVATLLKLGSIDGDELKIITRQRVNEGVLSIAKQANNISNDGANGKLSAFRKYRLNDESSGVQRDDSVRAAYQKAASFAQNLSPLLEVILYPSPTPNIRCRESLLSLLIL